MKPILFNDNWTCMPGESSLWFILGRGRGETPVPVILPHDASIHERRSPGDRTTMGKGGYPNGGYIYRKKFFVPAAWAEKRVTLEFEGVYMNAMVYLNGDFAGQCPNGYAGFTIPCNRRLNYGAENEIRVMCSGDQDSRWYAGTGIYRDVQLYVADPLHIPLGGVRLTTMAADEQVASLQAEIRLENEGLTNREVEVSVRLIDADGKVACKDTQPLHIGGGMSETIYPRLYVKNPRLWDLDEPNLYRAEVTVTENGAVIDESRIETFGIRVLTLDNIRGLAINGRSVKLNGGCIHHDNGILGAATFAAAEERRIRLLKSAGYNAVRMAHHAASKHLLTACDRYGVAVMDELTDMWTIPKNKSDYGHQINYRWEDDVRDLVEKDYNHPCVLMYSTGNEIPESGRPAGAEIYRMLGRLFRQLDNTRYITAGHNCMLGDVDAGNRAMDALRRHVADDINVTMAGLGIDQSRIMTNPEVIRGNREALEAMDIAGYNYATDRHIYDVEHFDNWISVGAETYPREIGYNWKLVMEHPAIIGDFAWAAWDYLGEAGIGRDRYKNCEPFQPHGPREPWFASCNSDFDMIGVRMPQGYYREIVVGHRREPYLAMQEPAHYADEPVVAGWSWPGTVSSWNWPGYEGKPIRVEVYARAEEAELLVNGVSLGRQPIPQETDGVEFACRTVFDTVYQPGLVETVVYAGGVEIGRYAVETADEAVELDVKADPQRDLCFVEVALRDARGRLNPGAVRSVSVSVEGPGLLQGLGSGNCCTEENFFDSSYRTHFGHALAAIRPIEAGEITVTVEAEGCKSVTVTV